MWSVIQIASQLKETKFAREGIMLDKWVYSSRSVLEFNLIDCINRYRFHKMLGIDEMRAWYGPDHVVLAADRGAIGTLLISDELFRWVYKLEVIRIRSLKCLSDNCHAFVAC